MPRDSSGLSEMSQQLLRAARAGRLYKPPEPPNDEDKENGDEDEEAKETQRGFSARKWTQVPRHLEEPEHEFLAKRRKGLPSGHSNPSGISRHLVPTGPTREAKIKRTDAEGNVTIVKILVPEGQPVEGEVVEEDVAVQSVPTAAPGTIVEGLGVVNADGVVVANEAVQPTPPRRRPPPPRRKPKKGLGRGRKKLVPTTGPDLTRDAAAAGTNGTATLGVPTIKTETSSGLGAPSTEGDTPMPDAQEGEDDEEEGEEGEEGEEDDDREEGELSPSPEPEADTFPSQPTKPSSPAISLPSLPPSLPLKPPAPANRDPSSSPELPLAAATSHSRQGSLSQNPPAAPSISTPAQPQGQDVTFSDGEVDLFGSLERHLESQSNSSKRL